MSKNNKKHIQENKQDNKQLVTAFNTVVAVCSVYKGDLNEHRTIQASLSILQSALGITNKASQEQIKEMEKEVEKEKKTK